MFDYTATVIEIGTTQQVTDTFKKRTLVMSDNHEKYPTTIAIDFCNDKASLLDSVSVGDKVMVKFFINSKKWNDKYFTNINASNIDVIERNTPIDTKPKQAQSPSSSPVSGEGRNTFFDNEDSDLPF